MNRKCTYKQEINVKKYMTNNGILHALRPQVLGMHSGVTKSKGLFLCDGELIMSGVQL